jgi:hypothetical protein
LPELFHEQKVRWHNDHQQTCGEHHSFKNQHNRFLSLIGARGLPLSVPLVSHIGTLAPSGAVFAGLNSRKVRAFVGRCSLQIAWNGGSKYYSKFLPTERTRNRWFPETEPRLPKAEVRGLPPLCHWLSERESALDGAAELRCAVVMTLA